MITFWSCSGCGTQFEDGDASSITDHVQTCDFVDGAGNPIPAYATITLVIERRPEDDLVVVPGEVNSDLLSNALDENRVKFYTVETSVTDYASECGALRNDVSSE